MCLVAEAQNGAEVLDFVRESECDVIVLDINMPGRSGLDLLRELKDRFPRVKVLILSMNPEDRFAIRALKAGASGYITKESAPDELVKAIRKVYDGGKYVSHTLAEKLAFRLDEAHDKPLHENLSDREFQVLQRMGEGKTLHEIAEELSLGLSTISTYRTRILEKMNLRSSAEIIHYAIKNHLVD